VKDTRAALVEHFAEGRLIHPAANVAPSADQIGEWWAEYAALSSDGDVASDIQAIVNGIPAALEKTNVGQADPAVDEIVDEDCRTAAE
jgi:ParB family chromosome partitioning protein